MAGGILGLWLFNLAGAWLPLIGMAELHLSFDMIAMLGFLILMGTVVNNPILIVDRAMNSIKEDGLAPLEAVNEAVSSRLRPIAMSTLTTICGLSPLVLLQLSGSIELSVALGLMSAILFWRHRSNIRNLLRGEEGAIRSDRD